MLSLFWTKSDLFSRKGQATDVPFEKTMTSEAINYVHKVN